MLLPERKITSLAAAAARVARQENMQRRDGQYENQGTDLQGRLQMSEQVRRRLTERMRDMLKDMKWVEPMTRPKGHAYEEVLIGALEEQLTSLKSKFEDSSRQSCATCIYLPRMRLRARRFFVAVLALPQKEPHRWPHHASPNVCAPPACQRADAHVDDGRPGEARR